MDDRRKSPRIRVSRKAGYKVTLFLKRFFFKERMIICTLRDLSEGGASLLVENEYAKYISPANIGAHVRLLSENTEITFSLTRRGRILRVIEETGSKSIVIMFNT